MTIRLCGVYTLQSYFLFFFTQMLYIVFLNRLLFGKGGSDPEEEILLTNHYLKHLSLLAVAREMHRGNSWVYDHHDAAIKKLDKILAESGDSEAS